MLFRYGPNRLRTFRTHARWRFPVLLVSTACLVLTGCSNNSAAGPTRPKVVIGYENLGATPEMVVVQKKWFQQYMNADVQLKEFQSGPAALTALGSGDLQFMTEIGNPPAASAMARGLPLETVWLDETFTTGEGLVVKNTSGIGSLRDLPGKRVGVVSGSSADYVLTQALERAGVPKSGIKLLNITPPGMLSAWDSGGIDAAYVWTPTVNQLAQQNGKIIFPDSDAIDYAPSVNVSVANKQWAAGHRDLVRQFVQAQDAGVSYTRQHPTEALAAMAAGAGISTSLAKTELEGIKFYSAREQLTPSALGAPNEPKAQTEVGLGLDGALNFLVANGLSSKSANGAPSESIETKYIADYLSAGG